MLAQGYTNPFLSIGMSYMYRSLADVKIDLTKTGQEIRLNGLPKHKGPTVFVFCGDGKVSQGAVELFQCTAIL